MGGIAFSLKDTRGLHTPRMPRTVYRFIRDICHAALRQRFMAVASPIEAPAKQDYGDVDIFVAWDVIGTPLGNYEDISSLLGTTYTRAEELVMCEAQFAVPWPDSLDEPSHELVDNRPRYCQIDLHICKSIEEFHWKLWYYAHGDLTPMIHNMLRPLDLTINHRGLFMRIPNIKKGAKKIFITNEPGEALRLLGYDPLADIWQEEFESLDQMFQHTMKCRLFRGFYGMELTGEDGSIMAVRETFRTWIADFIPSCGGVYSGTHLTIEGFRNEILERFPETRAEYDLATAKAETQKGQRDIYSRVIKASIPIEQDTNPRWRDVTAAVLRDIIMRSDYSLGFAPTRSLQICNGLYDEQEVKTFVEEAWKIVGDEAWDCYYGPSGKHSHHLEARLAEEAEMQACEGEGETYESDDEEDRIRFQSKPEGFRQTWYDTDMNDI